MIDKTPNDYSFLTYLWVFTIAMSGGVVSFMNKMRKGKKWKWLEFIAEITASAFAGVIMFYLAQSIGLSQITCVALSGIAGHSSPKALALMDELLTSVFKRLKK